eukprot:m.209 g.209  ORF g.209 m.209 type:complete len:123 (+) comp271_c0_seq1:359-727(+)
MGGMPFCVAISISSVLPCHSHASPLPSSYFEPSVNCGPFRGQETAWQTVEKLLSTAPNTVVSLLDFVTKPTFIVPLILYLSCVPYGYLTACLISCFRITKSTCSAIRLMLAKTCNSNTTRYG